MSDHENCPCGTGLRYTDCCGAIHTGEREAATAEQLMRSRYTAFVKDNEAYLLSSWEPSKRPESLFFDSESNWLGLKIKSTRLGQENHSEGWVNFVARYKVGGKAERIIENSYFTRHNGRWVYHSAADEQA